MPIHIQFLFYFILFLFYLFSIFILLSLQTSGPSTSRHTIGQPQMWVHHPSPTPALPQLFFSYRYRPQNFFSLRLAHQSQPTLTETQTDSKVDIMDHSISKKRKRREAEAAAPAASAEKISKKSKKAAKPVPAQEESSDDEEDDFEGFDEEEEDEDASEQPNGDGAAESGENDEDEEDEEAEANGVDLPSDNAPILPLSSDAQSFDQLKLSEKTMNAIEEMGFKNMTSIQKTVSFTTT